MGPALRADGIKPGRALWGDDLVCRMGLSERRKLAAPKARGWADDDKLGSIGVVLLLFAKLCPTARVADVGIMSLPDHVAVFTVLP